MNLLPIWVNLNEIGLTVDLGIKHFQKGNALILYEIVPTGSCRKFKKISPTILYLDIKGLT